eukprot:g1338.t1
MGGMDGERPGATPDLAIAPAPPKKEAPPPPAPCSYSFVDSHCHLELVAACAERDRLLDSLLPWDQLSVQHMGVWRKMGWTREKFMCEITSNHRKAGGGPEKLYGCYKNEQFPVFYLSWDRLSDDQRSAATLLGWKNGKQDWNAGKGTKFSERYHDFYDGWFSKLTPAERQAFIQLGVKSERLFCMFCCEPWEVNHLRTMRNQAVMNWCDWNLGKTRGVYVRPEGDSKGDHAGGPVGDIYNQQADENGVRDHRKKSGGFSYEKFYEEETGLGRSVLMRVLRVPEWAACHDWAYWVKWNEAQEHKIGQKQQVETRGHGAPKQQDSAKVVGNDIGGDKQETESEGTLLAAFAGSSGSDEDKATKPTETGTLAQSLPARPTISTAAAKIASNLVSPSKGVQAKPYHNTLTSSASSTSFSSTSRYWFQLVDDGMWVECDLVPVPGSDSLFFGPFPYVVEKNWKCVSGKWTLQEEVFEFLAPDALVTEIPEGAGRAAGGQTTTKVRSYLRRYHQMIGKWEQRRHMMLRPSAKAASGFGSQFTSSLLTANPRVNTSLYNPNADLKALIDLGNSPKEDEHRIETEVVRVSSGAGGCSSSISGGGTSASGCSAPWSPYALPLPTAIATDNKCADAAEERELSLSAFLQAWRGRNKDSSTTAIVEVEDEHLGEAVEIRAPGYAGYVERLAYEVLSMEVEASQHVDEDGNENENGPLAGAEPRIRRWKECRGETECVHVSDLATRWQARMWAAWRQQQAALSRSSQRKTGGPTCEDEQADLPPRFRSSTPALCRLRQVAVTKQIKERTLSADERGRIRFAAHLFRNAPVSVFREFLSHVTRVADLRIGRGLPIRRADLLLDLDCESEQNRKSGNVRVDKDSYTLYNTKGECTNMTRCEAKLLEKLDIFYNHYSGDLYVPYYLRNIPWAFLRDLDLRNLEQQVIAEEVANFFAAVPEEDKTSRAPLAIRRSRINAASRRPPPKILLPAEVRRRWVNENTHYKATLFLLGVKTEKDYNLWQDFIDVTHTDTLHPRRFPLFQFDAAYDQPNLRWDQIAELHRTLRLGDQKLVGGKFDYYEKSAGPELAMLNSLGSSSFSSNSTAASNGEDSNYADNFEENYEVVKEFFMELFYNCFAYTQGDIPRFFGKFVDGTSQRHRTTGTDVDSPPLATAGPFRDGETDTRGQIELRKKFPDGRYGFSICPESGNVVGHFVAGAMKEKDPRSLQSLSRPSGGGEEEGGDDEEEPATVPAPASSSLPSTWRSVFSRCTKRARASMHGTSVDNINMGPGEQPREGEGAPKISCDYLITSICDEHGPNPTVRFLSDESLPSQVRDRIFVAVGAHPKSVGFWGTETDGDYSRHPTYVRLKEICEKQFLNDDAPFRHKVVAYGEIGMDFSHKVCESDLQPKIRKAQRTAFEDHLKLGCFEYNLPLQIHSRSAEKDTVEILLKVVPRDHKIHLHGCFNSDGFLKKLLKEFPNLYVGVTCALENMGNILYYSKPEDSYEYVEEEDEAEVKKEDLYRPAQEHLQQGQQHGHESGTKNASKKGTPSTLDRNVYLFETKLMRQVRELIPLERLLVETDAPYLQPLANSDHPFSYSALLPRVIRLIASLKGKSERETALQLRENARRVYGI